MASPDGDGRGARPNRMCGRRPTGHGRGQRRQSRRQSSRGRTISGVPKGAWIARVQVDLGGCASDAGLRRGLGELRHRVDGQHAVVADPSSRRDAKTRWPAGSRGALTASSSRDGPQLSVAGGSTTRGRGSIEARHVVVPTGSGGWYPRSFVLTDIVDSVSLWERRPCRCFPGCMRRSSDVRLGGTGRRCDVPRLDRRGSPDNQSSARPHGRDCRCDSNSRQESRRPHR
jgi:hypothetical protein